jgi:alanyl-tRNA synthetase
MEKLYNKDSYIKSFTASVVSCERLADYYETVLDKTAFFPEQGGQTGDDGFIGKTEVFDTQIKNGTVYHLTKEPLEEGKEYSCEINWETRFRKMQHHTAEHIFSGIGKRLFNVENTGFHLDKTVTLDFDKVLTEEEILLIEKEVNKAIWENHPIRAFFPTPEEIEKTDYRSKKEVYDSVLRLVEIESVDMCACCAPHLKSTGEIGLAKVLSFMKHKGGVRIFITCGADAYADCCNKYENAKIISNLLSLPQENIAVGVKDLLENINSLKKEIEEKNNIIATKTLENIDYKDGNICVLCYELNSYAATGLVNKGKEKCSKIFVLCMSAGNSLRYVIGSNFVNLREHAKNINSALNGKGGGSESMIQGSFNCTFDEVKKYFE